MFAVIHSSRTLVGEVSASARLMLMSASILLFSAAELRAIPCPSAPRVGFASNRAGGIARRTPGAMLLNLGDATGRILEAGIAYM